MAPPRGHSWIRHCSQSQRMCKVTDIRPLTYEELKKFTNNFSKKNYMGKFQFGKVYHGIVESDSAEARLVTVKIWEPPFNYYSYMEGDNEMRMMDEVVLLRHGKLNCHPGMIKLYGYCCECEHIGVVYDFESKDTVQNLIIKGDFTWLDRVKVALGFADLLVFLHTQNHQNGPFVIRNIEPSHILVDKDYNPKLCDFGLIAGGIFAHKRDHTYANNGCLGSIDHASITHGGFTPKTDVHNFGLLLMKLMSNEIDNVEEIENNTFTSWAYERVLMLDEESDGTDLSMMPNRSMVAPCLQDDVTFFPEDGVEMSDVAYNCLDDDVPNRPTMEQVLASLLKLQIVKKYYDELGIERMVMKIKEEQ